MYFVLFIYKIKKKIYFTLPIIFQKLFDIVRIAKWDFVVYPFQKTITLMSVQFKRIQIYETFRLFLRP